MTKHLDIAADMAPRTLIMVGFDRAQILDIAGPLQILSAVNNLRRLRHGVGPAYHIILAAAHDGEIDTSSGLRLGIDRTFDDITEEDLDSLDALMVCGGEGTRAAVRDEALVDFVQEAAPHARRIVSICSGAFVLARAGLADGKTVATHWDSCAALARAYPSLNVDSDSIFVRDGNVWSSAGVTAGMDLALAMVEEDWGHDVAVEIARRHVLFMIRPGGQSQFSTHLEAQARENGRLGDLLAWIAENPSEDLTVPALAERAHMSDRTFARVFKQETGTTPADFVERARTDAARRALEDTRRSIDEIAWENGFGNAERMRRTFQRRLGVGPKAYRARFRKIRFDQPRDDADQEESHVHVLS